MKGVIEMKGMIRTGILLLGLVLAGTNESSAQLINGTGEILRVGRSVYNMGSATYTGVGGTHTMLSNEVVNQVGTGFEISPTSGTVGTTVTVVGNGFAANEIVRIDFGITKSIGVSVSDAEGCLKTTFTVNIQPISTITVTAQGLTSGASFFDIFYIIGPRIILTKTVEPTGTITPGATFTYTLEYKNIGTADAENLIIYDWLPDEVEFVGTLTPTLGPGGGDSVEVTSYEGSFWLRFRIQGLVRPGGWGRLPFIVRLRLMLP
jgi:uncharacterized repeat protein (TIGR01451 family)